MRVSAEDESPGSVAREACIIGDTYGPIQSSDSASRPIVAAALSHVDNLSSYFLVLVQPM